MLPGLALARSCWPKASRTAASSRKLGGVEFDQISFAPMLSPYRELVLPIFVALRPWGALYRGKRAVEPQGRDAFRICGGEDQAHRATFRPTVDGGPLGASRVHHGAHVAYSLFDGLLGVDAVGQSLAALVEDNDSSEGGLLRRCRAAGPSHETST
jgi:hypothetical protein